MCCVAGGEPAWLASSCFSASSLAWKRSRTRREIALGPLRLAGAFRLGADGLLPRRQPFAGLGPAAARFLELARLGGAPGLGFLPALRERGLLGAERFAAQEEVLLLRLEGDQLVAETGKGTLQPGKLVAPVGALGLLFGDPLGKGAGGLFPLAVRIRGGGTGGGLRFELRGQGLELLVLNPDFFLGPGDLDPAMLAELAEFLDPAHVGLLALRGPLRGGARLAELFADLRGLALDGLQFLAEAAQRAVLLLDSSASCRCVSFEFDDWSWSAVISATSRPYWCCASRSSLAFSSAKRS